jgi:hypothetical protein
MITARKVHTAASAFGACCMLLALAAFSSAAWAQVGYVHEISGAVSIQQGPAKAVPAKVGDTFESDTIFRTGADGKVILKFADGQVVALGADSAVRIGEYRYVARDVRQSTTVLELMKGEMRFVAGLIGAGNREGVHITAGDSMIHIQSPGGADFTVQVNPDPEEVGAAVVALGEISVRTPYGPIYKIEASQYVPWQPGRKPPPPMPITAAPAVIQAAMAALWTTVVPVNTPVAVASTARMAALAAATSQAEAATSADPRQVGYVDAVSNTVSVRTASGKTTSASVGDMFQAGTSFNTGTDGRVVLKFADGQLVVVTPGSILGVDQYQFDPRDLKASSSALDLADGAMRYVSGTIHANNHEGVNISAGASLVDILNTGVADFTVVVNTKQQEVGIAAVAAGEISVHTPYGPISKIETGQAAPWQPGQTPPLPEPIAAAPAGVQAAMAAVAATALPENTPIVVASAAQAAAAVAAASRAEAVANANPGNEQLRAAAQAAADQANTASQAAAAAAQAVAATIFASTLAALPATAAGPAQAQVPPDAPALPLPIAPINPTVTPGGGGKCVGSRC